MNWIPNSNDGTFVINSDILIIGAHENHFDIRITDLDAQVTSVEHIMCVVTHDMAEVCAVA